MATRRSKDEAALATLTASKDVAQANVEAARAKCTALKTPEQLLELIRAKTPQANDVRLRVRMEIRKRLSPHRNQMGQKRHHFLSLHFVNGAKLDKGILFRDGDTILCAQTSFERP